jgi:hypothetical protein
MANRERINQRMKKPDFGVKLNEVLYSNNKNAKRALGKLRDKRKLDNI